MGACASGDSWGDAAVLPALSSRLGTACGRAGTQPVGLALAAGSGREEIREAPSAGRRGSGAACQTGFGREGGTARRPGLDLAKLPLHLSVHGLRKMLTSN